jgi:hypothetical protein
MKFNGKENHKINLEEAAKLTSNYRNQFESGKKYIKGEAFGKNAIIDMLNQPNCVGTRIYYGLKNDGTQCLVLVGVDADGNDLVDGVILDMGTSCPPHCSTDNPLNSDM